MLTLALVEQDVATTAIAKASKKDQVLPSDVIRMRLFSVVVLDDSIEELVYVGTLETV